MTTRFADIDPFPKALDRCALHGLRVGLFRNSGRWTVEARDGQLLVAKCSTSEPTPGCFPVLGAKLTDSLARANREGSI